MANTLKQKWQLLIEVLGDKLALKKINTVKDGMSGQAREIHGVASAHTAAGKASANHYMKAKGVGNLTTNQTKAFAKMERGMTSGLVPAYATVAANIFALTAAFGALSRAADFQVLIAGAESLSVQTGRNLISLAGNMQEVTDNAITMKEALVSASIAASAGFDNETILELTQVARNASIALGRDMTDALNRVFKGAVKAEPELLDELGIILRLDPAARKYAASIGKAVTELTTFEKQQAVVNEVIAQGQEKFSKLSEVDVNPFTQLSAAFLEATNAILGFVNIGLGPIINVLTDNMYILIGAMTVFGNTILRAAIPALQQLQSEVAEGLTNSFVELSDTMESQDLAIGYFEAMKHELTDLDSVFNQTSTNIENSFDQFGADLPKDLFSGIQKDMASLNVPAERVKLALTSVNKALQDLDPKADDFEQQKFALQDMKGALEGYEFGLMKVEGRQEELKRATDRSTSAFKSFQNGMKLQKLALVNGFLAGTSGGFSNLGDNIDNYKKSLDKAQVKGVVFNKTLKSISVGIFRLTATMGALVKAIPFIGQLAFAFGILKSIVEKLFDLFRTNNEEILALNEAYDSYAETLTTLNETAENFNNNLKNLPNTIDNVTRKLTAQTNILNTMSSEMQSIIDKQVALGGFDLGDKILDYFNAGNIDILKDDIIPDNINIIKNLGIPEAVAELDTLLAKIDDISGASGAVAYKLNIDILGVINKWQDFLNVAKDANDSLIGSLDTLEKAVNRLNTSKLTDIQDVFLSLEATISKIDPTNIDLTASALLSLSTAEIFKFDIVDEIQALTDADAVLVGLRDSLNLVQKEMDAVNKRKLDIGFKDFVAVQKFLRSDAREVMADTDRLTPAIELLNETIAEQLELMNDLNTAALKQLKARLSYYEQLTKAQKAYNAELAAVNFEKTLPDNTIAASIALIERQTQATVRLNNLERAADASERTRLQDKINLIKGDITQAHELGTLKVLLQKQENKLAASQTKNAKAYTAQISGLSKLLVKVAKDESLGINLDINTDSLINDLIPAIHNIGKALNLTNEEIQIAIGSFESLAEFTKLQTITQGLTPDKVAGDILALDDKIRAFELESEYLRVNNQLIDERIDKEFLLAEAQAERQLFETAMAINSGELSGKHLTAKLDQERKLQEFLVKNEEAAAAFVISQIEQETMRGQIVINNRKDELAMGLRITAAQKAQLDFNIKKAVLDAQNIDKTTEAYKKQLKVFEDTKKLDITAGIKEGFDEATESISNFSDIMKELRTNIEGLTEEDGLLKFQAGLLAINQTAEESGDKASIAISQLGILASQLGDDIRTGTEEAKKQGKEFSAVGLQVEFMSSAMGAFAGAMEEGSKAAEVLKLAQMALAVVQAVNAVLTQGEGDPYTAFARMAAMAAAVAVLLSQANIAFGGGGSSSGPSEAEEYKASFGENRITGGDSQSNALVDSIDNLTTINDALYGAEKELKRAIYSLKLSFDAVGAALFNVGGGFNAGDITTKFGIQFGTELDPGFFGDETTETELLAGGLELGVVIKGVAGQLVGDIKDARLFITKQVTETDSGFLGFGGGTDVDIIDKFVGLDASLKKTLGGALDASLETIVQLVTNFGGDIQEYFGDFKLTLPSERINLVGLSATEQADAVGQYFSNVGNELLSQQLPWLQNWSRAGEELLDTLIRLTNSTLILNEAFSAGGTSIDELAGLSGIGSEDSFDKYKAGRQATIDFWEQQEKDSLKIVSYVQGRSGTRNSVPEIARFIQQYDDDIKTYTQAIQQLDDITDGYIGGGVSDNEFKSIINYYQTDAARSGERADNVTIDSFKKWHKQRVDNARAAWITALETYYGGTIDEFAQDYDRFLQAVFSDEELAKIRKDNAEEGIAALTGEIGVVGDNRFGKYVQGLIASIDSAERLGEVYAELETKGKFSGDKGAELLELFVALGIQFGELADATEEVEEAVDTFLRDMLRQIGAFGKEGKELDLLQLSFSYEDDLAEARTREGIDNAEAVLAVEVWYGLQRVQIIEDYNQEIVDSLEDAFSNIDDGILTIIKTTEAWNETAYNSLKIENIKKRLQKSFGTGDSTINTLYDYAEVFYLLEGIDTSGTEVFSEALGSFITFSEDIPETIQEQIDLANELTDAIMERYNSELGYVESLKQLSIDIKGFLDDLAVGELSPLTNMQMFEELNSRFIQDLADINSEDSTIAAAAGERILDNASALLELGSDLYAIGPEYQALFEFVAGSLAQVGVNLDDKVVSETELLTQLQETTIEELEAVRGILAILTENQMSVYEQDLLEATQAIDASNDNIYTILSENLPEMKTALLDWAGPAPISDIIPDIGSNAAGTETVPFDQLSMIHRGEMIIPEVNAEQLREGSASIGGAFDTSGIVSAIGTLTEVLAEGQEELIDQGERQIDTTQDIVNTHQFNASVGTAGVI